MVSELEPNTLGATLGPVEPKLPVETLADTCRGGGRDCSRDTEEVKVNALVYKQRDPILTIKGQDI